MSISSIPSRPAPSRAVARLFGAILLAVVAACSEGTDPTGVSPAESLSVEIVPAALDLTVGGTAQLSTVQRGTDGQTLPARPVTYRSTDVSVVTVTRGGLVRAVAPGSGAIVATVEGRSDSATVTVAESSSASALEPVQPPPLSSTAGDGSYSIRTIWVGPANARAQEMVGAAIARWTRVITGDLPNVTVDLPADACFDGQEADRQVVDDLLVYVRVVDIDGAHGTLARAGPCYVRGGTSLPIVGVIDLDEADLDRNSTMLESMLVHELGHVLGIGTIWDRLGLLHESAGNDPLFLGATALDAYTSMGGRAMVPVENEGGDGTRLGHWRESVFRTELMTGWLSSGSNPMSRMTIASLRDLGYRVNMDAADAYALPTRSGVTARIEGGRGVEIVDELIEPRFVVDEDGRVSTASRRPR